MTYHTYIIYTYGEHDREVVAVVCAQSEQMARRKAAKELEIAKSTLAVERIPPGQVCVLGEAA